jgi:hypothetical protein
MLDHYGIKLSGVLVVYMQKYPRRDLRIGE